MNEKRRILRNSAVQALIASLLCIVLGMLIGYIVLLFINPTGAWDAIMEVMKNFLHYSKHSLRIKNFGNTLVKTAPLLMCSLSVLFAYKVGLFNIGVAGQYVIGTCASLYAALAWGWAWLPCMLIAIVAGALYGGIVGLLKAYCNVNEVISGIMLNWIGLYMTNMLLTTVKETTSPYTYHLKDSAAQALLPTAGLEKFFNNNTYVTIAVPLSIILAVFIAILLDKTKFGYELKATGNNKNAAKYCGMAEKQNIILTLVIAGALASLGGALLYLTDYEQWQCTASSVPGMGFNGIAAAFLGGLNPIGTIFSSYFIQHITSGGAYVDKTMYCSQISDLISSIIIYLCGFVLFIKYAINRSLDRHDEKQAQKKKSLAATPEESRKGGDK
ncbi:MAG: ABC transporter permease [Clostridiales bacterium]|nr:ABC transporter permease [Clostridiales bacterium]